MGARDTKDVSGRPLWTAEKQDGSGSIEVLVVIEGFHHNFKAAQDLMEMIAEPSSRTSRLHVFKLTEDSLVTAIGQGMTGSEVIQRLKELSKNPLTNAMQEYITQHTSRAGKVRLVLDTKRVLTEMESHSTRKNNKVMTTYSWSTSYKLTNFVEMEAEVEEEILKDSTVRAQYRLEGSTTSHVHGGEMLTKFEVPEQAQLIEMKQYFKTNLRYPLDVVYAFSTDCRTTDVKIRLKNTARLRPYQSLTLSKTLGSGRARSGLIVLPCGAGKTLVGVSTAALLGKTTIVICLNSLTVMQWWQQFRLWTDVKHKSLTVFTSGQKEKPGDIVITTYSMLGFPDHMRAEGSPELVDALRQKEWGLMLLDEVHVAPAATFQNILNRVRAHCIIGLTATLLREDDKIKNLHYLVGPKLFEANWKELCDAGYLADVTCIEVLCPLRGCFFDAYLRAGVKSGAPRSREPEKEKEMLQVMNPEKIHVAQALIHFHRARGDKILLFSDSLPVIDIYAKLFHIPQIVGDVGNNERYSIINHFKYDNSLYAIALSAAAETGTDMPDANVIIQISGMFGSQRQETQRLGRILRPKHSGQGNCGWYYSLVSKDTREPGDHARRRRFLQEQGYSFKVVASERIVSHYVNEGGSLFVSTPEQELDLLDRVSPGSRDERFQTRKRQRK